MTPSENPSTYRFRPVNKLKWITKKGFINAWIMYNLMFLHIILNLYLIVNNNNNFHFYNLNFIILFSFLYRLL
jgi:hypothetical protein